MRNKIILSLIAFFLVLSMILPVSAEVYLWNDVLKNDTTVNHHLYYWFDDTSENGIGAGDSIPVTMNIVVQTLPYTMTYGVVDYCDFTYYFTHNQYEVFLSYQKLVNVSTTTYTLHYENQALNSTFITIDMVSRDSLIADMKCHYTDSRSLYEENALIGQITTHLPSFECKQCSKYTLEELSQATEKSENITANELAIYNNIQTAIDWNFQIWLIASWIFKILFVFIAVGLIFGGVYYFYMFIKNLGDEIR